MVDWFIWRFLNRSRALSANATGVLSAHNIRKERAMTQSNFCPTCGRARDDSPFVTLSKTSFKGFKTAPQKPLKSLSTPTGFVGWASLRSTGMRRSLNSSWLVAGTCCLPKFTRHVSKSLARKWHHLSAPYRGFQQDCPAHSFKTRPNATAPIRAIPQKTVSFGIYSNNTG